MAPIDVRSGARRDPFPATRWQLLQSPFPSKIAPPALRVAKRHHTAVVVAHVTHVGDEGQHVRLAIVPWRHSGPGDPPGQNPSKVLVGGRVSELPGLEVDVPHAVTLVPVAVGAELVVELGSTFDVGPLVVTTVLREERGATAHAPRDGRRESPHVQLSRYETVRSASTPVPGSASDMKNDKTSRSKRAAVRKTRRLGSLPPDAHVHKAFVSVSGFPSGHGYDCRQAGG